MKNDDDQAVKFTDLNRKQRRKFAKANKMFKDDDDRMAWKTLNTKVKLRHKPLKRKDGDDGESEELRD